MWRRSSTRPGPNIYLEHRVVFPTVPGAFGTADLIVRIGSTIHVIDFKFGAGVRVLALYPDGDEDIINAQLMFYAAGARHSLPEFFAGVDNIVLTILQPHVDRTRRRDGVVGRGDARRARRVYRGLPRRLRRSALGSAAPGAGRLCRFCPAKPICPAHTGPLLDLAQFEVPTPSALPSKQAYLQVLADGLNLVDAVKDIGKALHDQAKRALENGDLVPGYALSAGRAERHWRDDEGTRDRRAERLGLSRDDIIAEAMRSPKQVELRAKARGLKVPKEFIVSHPLRRLAGAGRKRTRPGARTGRARAVVFRGTHQPSRRASND